MADHILPLKQLKQDDLMRWLAFGFIALAVLAFYSPSLSFPPRADQVIYLAETANNQHPLGLIIGSYDHNRHRTIAPGDELLFRPLLYVLLGSEQVFFGHHFWAWQLLTLIAHLTLLWVLLRLSWRLTNPWLAFASTWLFALSVINYELVTWTHLTSYILMMACVVSMIEQVILCFEENQVAARRMLRLLLYSLIACFIYETANIFVLIIAAILIISFPRMKWRLCLLGTPVILYIFSSYYNFSVLNHITHLTEGHSHVLLTGKQVGVFNLSLWWLYEGIFNGLYHYVFAIRTMFRTDEVMVFKPLVLNDPQVVLELLIFPAFLGLVLINGANFFKRIKVVIILLGMLLAYVAVIVLGRSHEMGNVLTAVRVNSYFPYIFWVIVVMLAFLLMPASKALTKLQRVLIIFFVTASILSGAWQGKRIYEMAQAYAEDTNNIVLLVTTLDFLIEEKKAEPDFSFYVDPTYPGNYSYGSIRKITDPPSKKYTFAELLYPQYFRPKAAAKYKFLAKNAQ